MLNMDQPSSSRQDINVHLNLKDIKLSHTNTTKSAKVPLKKVNLCGLGFCHPAWLQQFSSPKWFLAIIGLFVLVQSMMVSGITSSVITTIEKRYGLRSAESGLVVSSFDIGSLVVVVFISYFGGRSHRARWVGIGAVVVAIGAVFFAFPQFLSSPYQPSNIKTDTSNEIMCSNNHANNNNGTYCEAREANSLYLLTFILSNMVMGIGSTPIYTLGATFLYDNVPKEDASLYVSILYATGAIGPAAGYLLGGFFLTFYVDFGTSLSSDDPRFLGAWWLGYLACGGVILIISVFLLMFPRKLTIPASNIATPAAETPMTPVSVTTVTETTSVTMNSLDTSVISFGANLKEMPKAFASLLCNPIYMFVTCAATLEFSIVTAFLTFVPKYLQSHFNADTVISSIMTGAILVPSAGSGILLGGYIIKRLKLNLTGCAKTALLSNFLSMVLFISVFFITCDMNSIVGVTTFVEDPLTKSMSRSLSSACNNDCSCNDTSYAPVCYEGLTYYNPCYAGCQESFYGNNSQSFYTKCACLPSTVYNSSLFATNGECHRDCNAALAPFLVCLFLVTMATVCAHTPSIMVTYGCVSTEQRPFAAGIQFLFFRALAYIPAPIYFGLAIDQACLYWDGGSNRCSDESGSCLLYESSKFRYIFFGVAFTCKVLAAVFMFLAWLFCRREYSQHTHTTKWRRMRAKQRRSKINRLNQKHSRVTCNNSEFSSRTKPNLDQDDLSRPTPLPSLIESSSSNAAPTSSLSSVNSSGSDKNLIKKSNSTQLEVISSNISDEVEETVTDSV